MRKQLENTSAQLNNYLKNEKSTKMLDNILNSQGPIHNIGFEEGQNSKTTQSPKKINGDVIKRSINSESTKKEEGNIPHKDNKGNYKRSFPSRHVPVTKFQHSFYGYCFSCNHFGHKVVDCRVRARNDFGFLLSHEIAPC